MNDKLIIRSYKESDKKPLIDLWFECKLVVPWNNPEHDIDRKLKVNPELFLVGYLGKELAASVMAGYEGHRGWVNYLSVAKKYRGRGYGREMMDVVEEKLRNMGCPKVQLQVRNTNEAVINYYEHLGYRDDCVVTLGKRLEKDPPFLQKK